MLRTASLWRSSAFRWPRASSASATQETNALATSRCSQPLTNLPITVLVLFLSAVLARQASRHADTAFCLNLPATLSISRCLRFSSASAAAAAATAASSAARRSSSSFSASRLIAAASAAARISQHFLSISRHSSRAMRSSSRVTFKSARAPSSSDSSESLAAFDLRSSSWNKASCAALLASCWHARST